MLPTDSLIQFFVCDTVREEKNNKISLIGLYVDEVIRLAADARFPASFQLSLVYVLRDGQGTFNGTIEVKAPPPHPPFNGQISIQKNANEAGVIMLGFTPFVAFAFGKIEVVLTLDSQSYLRNFEIATA
jgi:hypothetical protein